MIDDMTPPTMSNLPAPASPLPEPLRRRAERFGLALPAPDAGEAAIIDLAVELFFRPLRWPVPARELVWRERGDGQELDGGGFVRVWEPDTSAPGARKPAVLLAHGWEGRATQLAPIAAALLAAGYPVAGVDAPAHGEAPGLTASMPRYAANLLEAAERVGSLAGFIGHSFGGAAGVLALSRGMKAPRAAILAAPSDITGLGRRFAASCAFTGERAAAFIHASEARAGILLTDLVTTKLVGNFTIPGLILHDPADRYVDYAESETLAAAWPGARMEPVPGAGHLSILANPAIVDRLVRWIAEGT